MNSKNFLMLSELFENFRIQALTLLKEAEEFGFIDDVTQCFNRKAYETRVQQLGDVSIGIIVVDVNGLKRINDIQGHFAGDLVLKDLGKMLKAYFGGNDVFRVAGDEFIILKPKINPIVFERMVDEFRIAYDSTHKTSVALGCTWEDTTNNLKSSIVEAEQKMYADKKRYYQTKQLKS